MVFWILDLFWFFWIWIPVFLIQRCQNLGRLGNLFVKQTVIPDERKNCPTNVKFTLWKGLLGPDRA